MAPRLQPPVSARAPDRKPVETLRVAVAMGRALAESVSQRQRLGLARAFTRAVLESYWRTVHPMPKPALPPLRVPIADALEAAGRSLAVETGVAAAALDPIEASYAVGRTYAALLPDNVRASLGAYYTPPAVVERLLEQATAAGVDWRTCRALDPACGGGAFLAPLARRMAAALRGCEPAVILRNISERLVGLEIDPFAAWMSQVFLEVTLADVSRVAGKRLPRLVTVCNSLTHEVTDRKFDLVIGNPPYGRVGLKPSLRSKYARSLYGHANLYGLFTDLAIRYAAPQGVISYVTPTSFLGGQYFRRLRELLLKEAPPVCIDFIAARRGVFDDVLQETLLATYARGGQSRAVAVALVETSGDVPATVHALGSFSIPTHRGAPWILPRAQREASLGKALSSMPHRLSDYGYAVSTGPLVWNRYKDQLRQAQGPGCVPLIWAEAVTSLGCFIFRAEKKNHAPYFRPKNRDNWLLVRTPCVLVQRTTAKEQDRRIIAAELPLSFLREHGAVTVENHLNMIVDAPCGALWDPQAPVTPSLLSAFLNSRAVDRAFRCISGSVAVSAYELEALPLPPPAALVELRSIMGNVRAFEAACAKLYGGE